MPRSKRTSASRRASAHLVDGGGEGGWRAWMQEDTSVQAGLQHLVGGWRGWGDGVPGCEEERITRRGNINAYLVDHVWQAVPPAP